MSVNFSHFDLISVDVLSYLLSFNIPKLELKFWYQYSNDPKILNYHDLFTVFNVSKRFRSISIYLINNLEFHQFKYTIFPNWYNPICLNLITQQINQRCLIQFNHLININLSNCNLNTLPIIPDSVIYLDISHNKFNSFNHFPKQLISLNCSFNPLTSLIGCPPNLQHTLYCDNNQLNSLTGCPPNLQHTLYCSYNQLTSLTGCPPNLQHTLDCYNNQLTSLIGCPPNLQHTLDCSYNQLTSLTGCPPNLQHTLNLICQNPN